MPLLGLYFAGAILWFITVAVTQDHQLDWHAALKWVAFAGLVGFGVFVALSAESLELPAAVAIIASIIARTLAIFYFIWREYRGYGVGKVFEITGIYLGWSVMTQVGYHFLNMV